ncbi:hypothetical protein H0H93_007123 [Arthromyces matolae]|nr:hypothetical protein H0H93_007123 [Arthromyces matolae]
MRFMTTCLFSALIISASTFPINTLRQAGTNGSEHIPDGALQLLSTRSPPLKIVIPPGPSAVDQNPANTDGWVEVNGPSVESLSSGTLTPHREDSTRDSQLPSAPASGPLHQAPVIGDRPETSQVPYWEEYPTHNKAKLRSSVPNTHPGFSWAKNHEDKYGLGTACAWIAWSIARDAQIFPNKVTLPDGTPKSEYLFHGSVTYDAVVEKVKQLVQDGIHIVASAGTAELEIEHPLRKVPEVIIVGGVEPQSRDEPNVHLSNFGNHIDVWGMSTKTYAPFGGFLFDFLMRPKQKLKAVTGTAVAAAQAAGVLACEISASSIKPSPLVAKTHLLTKSQTHDILGPKRAIKNAKLLQIPPKVSGRDDQQQPESSVYDLTKRL